MGSIASLGKMVSGLQAAKKGLQVTGQNLSNINTSGYTRQQLIQTDSQYLAVGKMNVTQTMQVGNGVTPTEIRQIRDDLIDRRIRTENSILNYHQTVSNVLEEVTAFFDEPYGSSVAETLNNFWTQAQKLSTAADGVEERQSFISSADMLMDRMNSLTSALQELQNELNSEVISSVEKVNSLFKQIKEYNDLIAVSEANGDNANDYRDQRNLLLDELSGYGEITYREDEAGRVIVRFEDNVAVSGSFVNTIDLKQTIQGSSFVTPVWRNTNDPVYKFDEVITSTNENNTGSIKALLVARGEDYVDSSTEWSDLAFNDSMSVSVSGNSYTIPTIIKQLDEFANTIVDIVNSSFDGYGIGAELGNKGVTVFVPINGYEEFVKAEEVILKGMPDPNDTAGVQAYKDAEAAMEKIMSEMMTVGNIQVNPKLLEDGGYNKLGTVTMAADGSTDAKGDNSKVTAFLQEWSKDRDWFKDAKDPTTPYFLSANMSNFYAQFVSDVGSEASTQGAAAEAKYASVQNIGSERQAISGVSQDEELSNMLKYQYAYSAASRVITVMDSMLETLINQV